MSKVDFSNASLQTIHDIFGHSKSSLIEWKGEGMPYHTSQTGKKDVFDVPKVYKWILDREITKIIGDIDTEDESGEPTDYLERVRKYQAETSKFNLKIKRGEYIEKEQILLDLRLLVTHAMKNLQALGKELAFKLSNLNDIKEIESMIEERVVEILEQISLSNIQERNDEETTY